LSAGQKRRTALACLVARRAELWLLDEPHAGLDASGRDDLDDTLRQAAASGATVIVASHELERAGALATRAVVVDNGMVFPADTATEPPSEPPAPATDTSATDTSATDTSATDTSATDTSATDTSVTDTEGRIG
jgi:energy-coupling factor transporter ATP-binding protein EcfA2